MGGKLTTPIRLAEQPIAGISDFLSWTFAKFCFFRWMWFRNNPRNELILLRSTLSTALLASVYYIVFSDFRFLVIGVDVHPVFILLGINFVIYSNMMKDFSQRSNYGIRLYNDIIQLRSRQDQDWYSYRYATASFAVQLLSLELWGHRDLSHAFNEAIELVIEDAGNKGVKFPDKLTKDTIYSQLNTGVLRCSQIRSILFDYMRLLDQDLAMDSVSKAASAKSGGEIIASTVL